MGSRFEYVFYKCHDCDIDFLLAKRDTGRKKTFCPKCGENVYTDKVSAMWLERPFQYKRSWTTEEDEIIESGRLAGYSFIRIQETLHWRTLGAVRQRSKELRKRSKRNESD